MFWGNNCLPCREFITEWNKKGSFYRDLKSDFNVKFYKIEDNPDLVKRYRVTVKPTFIVIHKSKIVAKRVGYDGPRSFLGWLNSIIKGLLNLVFGAPDPVDPEWTPPDPHVDDPGLRDLKSKLEPEQVPKGSADYERVMRDIAVLKGALGVATDDETGTIRKGIQLVRMRDDINEAIQNIKEVNEERKRDFWGLVFGLATSAAAAAGGWAKLYLKLKNRITGDE